MIKNIKYYIVIGICCCLIGALFYKNSTSKDNGNKYIEMIDKMHKE